VKPVPENFKQPFQVEKCDFINGCKCSLAKVVPEKAKGRQFDTVYKYDTHIMFIGPCIIVIVEE